MSARENAKSVRDYLSSETWLAINRLYHNVSRTNLHLILADGLYDFCDGVITGAHLIDGTVDQRRSCATRAGTGCAAARTSSAPTCSRASSTPSTTC